MAGLEKPNSWVLQDWNLQRAWGGANAAFFQQRLYSPYGHKTGSLISTFPTSGYDQRLISSKRKVSGIYLECVQAWHMNFPHLFYGLSFFFHSPGKSRHSWKYMVLMAEQPPNTFPKWPPERAIQSEIYNYLGRFCEQKVSFNCFKLVKGNLFFFIFSENKAR